MSRSAPEQAKRSEAVSERRKKTRVSRTVVAL